jgi:hypothetical protein
VVGTDDIVEVRPEGECEHDNVEDLVSDAVEEGHGCELYLRCGEERRERRRGVDGVLMESGRWRDGMDGEHGVTT